MESLIAELLIHETQDNLNNILLYLRHHLLEDYISFSKTIINKVLETTISPQIQIEILKVFIDHFFLSSLTLKQISLIPFSNIFDTNNALYSTLNKSMLLTSYYNYYYPKQSTHYAVDDLIDYLQIENEVDYMWTEAQIKEVDTFSNICTVKLLSNSKIVTDFLDSLKIQPHKKFSEDQPWRSALGKGDEIDILDKENNWYKATVNHNSGFLLDIGQRESNEKPSKRLFTFQQSLVGLYNINNIRMRRKDTFSFDVLYQNLIPTNPNNNRKHNPHSMHIPYENKYFIIPKFTEEFYRLYSIEYSIIGNYLIEKLLVEMNKDMSVIFTSNQSIEHFDILCNLIHALHECFHLKFARVFIRSFTSKAFGYLINLAKNTDVFQSIDSIMNLLKNIAEMGYYQHEIEIIFQKFELELGVILIITKPSIDNQLCGLNILIRQLKNMQYDIFQTEKTALLTHQASSIDWDNLIEIIFETNYYEDAVTKATDLVKQLIKAKVISKSSMIHIFTIASTKDSILRHAIYKLFTKHTYEIGQETFIHLINRLFETLDPLRFTKEEATILFNPSQSFNSFNNSFLDTVLDNFFNLITKHNRQDLMELFTELIISKHIWTDMRKLFLFYINKLIDLFSVNGLYDQFKFLAYFLNSIPKYLEDDMEPELAQAVFKDNQHNVAKLIIGFCSKDNEDRIDILSLLLDMIQLTKTSSDFLANNNNFIEESFAIFVNSSINKRQYYFDWLGTILEKNLMPINAFEGLFSLLNSIIDKKEKDFIPSNDLISFFWTLFIKINDLNKKHLTYNIIPPFDLKYSSNVWNLIVNSNERELLYIDYIDLFALPYVNQTDRSVIWKQMIDCIISLIKTSNSLLNKTNCLKSLIALINISDYYGTANCIPHSVISKSTELSIIVVNSIIKQNESKFTMTISSNITLYDFKLKISETIEVNHHCFGIYTSPQAEFELSPKQNGQTIGCLFINDNIKTVHLLKSPDLDSIPQERLTIDPWTYTPDAQIVLIDIFNQHSTNGKMSKEQLARVITISLNLNQMISIDNPNVLLPFNKYDTDRDNMITLDEFLDLYLEIIRENNEDTVWQYLKHCNYRNDLRKLTDSLKKEPYINDKPSLMPRFVLSQDSAYFELVFNIQKDTDYDVSSSAYNIINMIETNQLMYNEILDNGLSNSMIKDKDDCYSLIYSMNIMNAIFNSINKEKEAKCIQAFTLQNDYNSSSFKMLLELFMSQMKDLTYVNNIKLTMYLLELQLIKKTLLYSIDNDCLNKLLNYSGEHDHDHDKESDIMKIDTEKISSLIKSNINYTHLDRVIKIISDNIPILIPQYSQLDTMMNILKTSFQILLIALLVYGEKDLNGIIGIELMNFLINQFKIQYPYLQQMAYITIKIIITQYQQDIPFLKSIEQIIMKKFKLLMSQSHKQIQTNDNDKDNNFDPAFLIKVYQDILKLRYYSKEEKATVIDEFVSLADSSTTPKEKILIGYFTILKTLIESISEISSSEKLISIVLDKFLFGLAFSSDTLIQALFDLLTIFITKSKENLILLYSHETITKISNYITKLSPEKRFYNPIEESRDTIGYVGIKNLGAICYMNSVLQQFFHIKTFSHGINEVPKPKDSDTVLYQLQRMYSYLELSNRKEYSPNDFVDSFKDFNGKPTDYHDQCDAQEFLSRFLEQIENSLKGTHLKYLISGIFGGESCSQLKCLNPLCKKISNRFEHLYYFSLDIKSVSTLEDSLSKFIQEERIEDFMCEKCHIKGDHTKRVSFNRLPNVLFIHLQRISFNFNREENEKIDSRLTFQKDLNLRPFCTETLQTPLLNDDDEFNANVYNKEDDYYQYKLVGVIIHSGNSNCGHYYSLINVTRDEQIERWVNFNDGTVSEYSISNLEENAFGGVNLLQNDWAVEINQSAYMLVYERIKKTNLSIVIDNEIEKDNSIEVIDKAKLNKLIDRAIPIELKEKMCENVIESKESQHTSVILSNNHAINKNYTVNAGDNITQQQQQPQLQTQPQTQTQLPQREYIEIISYDSYTQNTQKRLFFDEVLNDNIKFINDKKIYSLPFSKLIEASIKEININNNDLPEETVISLYKQIHSLIEIIITKTYCKDNIIEIITELIKIMKTRPLLIEFLISDLCLREKDTYLSFFIFTPDALVGEAYALYVAEIIKASIELDIQPKIAFQFIEALLDYFPHQLVKKWSLMVNFFEIFNHLSTSANKKIINYLISKGTILKMCEVYLGKDYPYYKGIKGLDSNNQSTPGKFSPLISTIANLITFISAIELSDEEVKCLSCSQFSQKGFDNNYDADALLKITSKYNPISNSNLGLNCGNSGNNLSAPFHDNDNASALFYASNDSISLKGLIEKANNANDFESIKTIFELIKQKFIHSNENTQEYLENLIGVMQFSNNYSRICYMAPALNEHETIVTKVLNIYDKNYFIDVVELFYEFLLTNAQIPRYISNFLPSCGANIEYGVIQEISKLYSNKIQSTEAKAKDEAFQTKIANISKLQMELDQSLKLEDKSIPKCEYDLSLLKIKLLKEITIADQEIIYSLNNLKCITLYKSIIDLHLFNDLLFENNLSVNPENKEIKLNDFEYYVQNFYHMFHGNKQIREKKQDTVGLKNTIVRYFLINIHFQINVNVGVTFTGSHSSKFPTTELVVFVPIRSIKEVIVVRKEYDTPHTITVRAIQEVNKTCSNMKNNINRINGNIIDTNSNQQKKVMFESNLGSDSNLYTNSVSCTVCDRINYISETETEFKCTNCTAFLFQ